MDFGLTENTFCYYLRNIEHVPLINGSLKKVTGKWSLICQNVSGLPFPEMF